MFPLTEVKVTFTNQAATKPKPEPTYTTSVSEAVRLINAIEFKAGLKALGAEIHAEEGFGPTADGVALVRFRVHVPHRDTDERIPIQCGVAFPFWKLQTRDVYELVMEMVMDVLVHEAYEGLFVNGAIWRDPHVYKVPNT